MATPFAHKSLSIDSYLRNYPRFSPSPIRITPSLAFAIIVIIIIINIIIRAEGAQHTTSTVVTDQSLKSVLDALRVPAARPRTRHFRAEHVAGKTRSGGHRGASYPLKLQGPRG
jgi:hypothetical protein